MALGETQALLAHLFTQAQVRREFFEAPALVAQRFGLNADEAERMAALDRREVEAFARSLSAKRVLDMRKTMPLTARALDEKFDEALLSLAPTLTPDRHRADAAMLTRRLRDMSLGGEIDAWVADLARYELAYIEAARSGLVVRRFRYDVQAIGATVRSGGPVTAISGASVGVWVRLNRGWLWHKILRLHAA